MRKTITQMIAEQEAKAVNKIEVHAEEVVKPKRKTRLQKVLNTVKEVALITWEIIKLIKFTK